jgi:hypothetical protein
LAADWVLTLRLPQAPEPRVLPLLAPPAVKMQVQEFRLTHLR